MFLSDSVGQEWRCSTFEPFKIFVSMPSHAVVELPNMLICLSLATTYANTSLASISKEPHS
ncbi:hypothetical protein CJF32_00002759 [Rutstroemia sp. NJR-2017a WRK4]|nr:hypothetical protein CJF32_00002759 [Rutstroemia sp. NJR-2017a WRK4]